MTSLPTTNLEQIYTNKIDTNKIDKVNWTLLLKLASVCIACWKLASFIILHNLTRISTPPEVQQKIVLDSSYLPTLPKVVQKKGQLRVQVQTRSIYCPRKRRAENCQSIYFPFAIDPFHCRSPPASRAWTALLALQWWKILRIGN